MNCSVCRKQIALSDLLKCVACKKHFHYQCLNITCAKYSALYPTKKLWRCDSCSNVTTSRGKNSIKNTQARGAPGCEDKASSSIGKTSERKESTVTGRITEDKKSIYLLSNSMEDLSSHDLDMSSTLLDTTARSLPNVTQVNDSLVQGLNEQISALSIDLNSAHEEIITLNEENTKLKLEVQELKKKIIFVTKLSSSITSTPVSTISLNSSSTQRKSKKKIVFGKLESTQKSCLNINSPKTIEIDTAQMPDQNINIVTVEEINSNNKLLLESNEQDKSYLNVNSLKAIEKDIVEMSDLNINKPLHLSNDPAKSSVEKNKIKSTPKMGIPMIHIIGDESANGIARQLRNIRYNNFNDNYRISAFFKPQALYSEILKDLKELITRLAKNDIIILTLGSNEKASNLKSDVENLLQKYDIENVVFLCVIQANKYSNTTKLHKSQKAFKSVIYKFHIKNVTEMHSLLNLVHKLNIEIDYLHYKEEFITNFGKHVRGKTAPQTCDILKVGTIPYYFHKQKLKIEQKLLENNSKIPKIGTIPYYFKQTTTTTETQREVFFRKQTNAKKNLNCQRQAQQ